MVLVDTSLWVEHFRHGRPELARLLERDEVTVHPFVLGELSLGNLPRRAEVLGNLQNLPRGLVADESEVTDLVEKRRLWGRGIGWIDAHLLASALISGSRLWTLDRSLHEAATALSVAR